MREPWRYLIQGHLTAGFEKSLLELQALSSRYYKVPDRCQLRNVVT